MEDDKISIVHFFRQFGFMRSKCRDEVNRFSQERGTLCDPESKTRLIDFDKVHTQLFDCLGAEFALVPSATRIGKTYHGVEWYAYDEQTVHDFNDARGRYMFDNVYSQGREQRVVIYKRVTAVVYSWQVS